MRVESIGGIGLSGFPLDASVVAFATRTVPSPALPALSRPPWFPGPRSGRVRDDIGLGHRGPAHHEGLPVRPQRRGGGDRGEDVVREGREQDRAHQTACRRARVVLVSQQSHRSWW